jgi:hypothetical protein
MPEIPTTKVERNRIFAWEKRANIKELAAKIKAEDYSLSLWGREDNEDDIHRRTDANDKRQILKSYKQQRT